MSEFLVTSEMWKELMDRLGELESRTVPLITLGPSPDMELEDAVRRARVVEKIVKAVQEPPPPVDRSCQVLVSGAPVPEDRSHTKLKDNGQQKDYVVLCDGERARGFVRPYRDAYRHLKCGKITTMGRAIAETYARCPDFYSATMCVHCGAHFPVGENGEFVWYEMDGTTGPKVGT